MLARTRSLILSSGQRLLENQLTKNICGSMNMSLNLSSPAPDEDGSVKCQDPSSQAQNVTKQELHVSLRKK